MLRPMEAKDDPLWLRILAEIHDMARYTSVCMCVCYTVLYITAALCCFPLSTISQLKQLFIVSCLA